MAEYLSSQLLRQVEDLASEKYGGHYTIFKFTTEYKGIFGTPEGSELRNLLSRLPPFKRLDELLYWMVEKEQEMNAYINP